MKTPFLAYLMATFGTPGVTVLWWYLQRVHVEVTDNPTTKFEPIKKRQTA